LETWAQKTNLLPSSASVFFFYSRTFTRQLSVAEDTNMRNLLSLVMAKMAHLKRSNFAQVRRFHSRADDESFSYDSPFNCDVSENLAPSHISQA
jgi:hypothetical protein